MNEVDPQPTKNIVQELSATFTHVFLGLVVLCSIGLICIAPTVLEFPYRLLLGWIHFLRNNLRELSFNNDQILIGILSLVGFIVSLEIFNSSILSTSFTWQRMFKSCQLSCLLMLIFTSGLSFTGIISNSGEVIATKDTMWVNRFDFHIRRNKILREMGNVHSSYLDNHQSLPPIGTYDAQGHALHGWMTLLLPYIGVNNLAELVDLEKPWDDPENRDFIQRDYYEFSALKNHWKLEEPEHCLGSPLAANPYVMGLDVPKKIDNIPDGAANVFIVGTVHKKMSPWGSPFNYRDPKLGLNQSEHGFGYPEHNSMQVIMADGSVRSLSSMNGQPDMQLWMRMAMPDDGEPLDNF